MEHNENENGIIAKLSPEAAMLNAVTATRHRFDEIEFEEFSEVEPEDVMALMVGVINILNIATKCADRAKADSMDAFVYFQTAFCYHEGLVNHIRDWNPDESKFVSDESSKKVFGMINEIRPLFLETFDKCHDRFHAEKIIDVQTYEKDINKLMMALGRIEGVEAKISCESESPLRYSNISNEDAIAVMKMAANMEMEEIHDFEVAQAVASYINSKLPEGQSAKDLDNFDMMNACLGYKILDMNKGDEELQKFIEDCVDRNQEVPPKCEPKKDGDGPNKMFAKVPAYQLSGNRMLVFEPDGFSSEIPKEDAEMVSAKVNEKVMRGMAFLMELTPKDKIPEFIFDVVTGRKEFDDSKAEEARQSLVSWLRPWAGNPVTFEVKEEGKEGKTVKVYEGSCLFGAIDGFLNSEKGKIGFCSFPVELACVLGYIWKEGPEKFVNGFLKRSISLEDAIDGSHYFRSTLRDHDFEVELDNKTHMIVIRRK